MKFFDNLTVLSVALFAGILLATTPAAKAAEMSNPPGFDPAAATAAVNDRTDAHPDYHGGIPRGENIVEPRKNVRFRIDLGGHEGIARAGTIFIETNLVPKDGPEVVRDPKDRYLVTARPGGWQFDLKGDVDRLKVESFHPILTILPTQEGQKIWVRVWVRGAKNTPWRIYTMTWTVQPAEQSRASPRPKPQEHLGRSSPFLRTRSGGEIEPALMAGDPHVSIELTSKPLGGFFAGIGIDGAAPTGKYPDVIGYNRSHDFNPLITEYAFAIAPKLILGWTGNGIWDTSGVPQIPNLPVGTRLAVKTWVNFRAPVEGAEEFGPVDSYVVGWLVEDESYLEIPGFTTLELELMGGWNRGALGSAIVLASLPIDIFGDFKLGGGFRLSTDASLVGNGQGVGVAEYEAGWFRIRGIGGSQTPFMGSTFGLEVGIEIPY